MNFLIILFFNITLDPKNLDKITQKIDKNYNLFTVLLKKNSYRNHMIIILNNKILSIDESHIINLIDIEGKITTHSG